MVICEKPLANTVADVEPMVKAVKDNNVLNAICFNYRAFRRFGSPER
jgi:predicted dehydrogenase